jgi:phage shock protein A
MTKVNAPSNEQLMQLILSLKAENEALKATKPQRAASISMDKLGRMSIQLAGSVPFAFYLDQWDKFEPMFSEAKAFIKEFRSKMPDEATRKAAAKARKTV